MMNYIWIIMIALSCFCAVAFGNVSALSDTIISGGASAITLSLKLMGAICFWSGIMNIAEKSGLTNIISAALSPVMKLIFPKLSRKSPAVKAMSMNITANLLGLGGAATPFGLEAMSRLKAETDAPEGDASNEMVKFVVINSAAIHLLPTTIAMLRGEYGSASPMDIFFPSLVTSVIALSCGLALTFIFEKGARKNAESNRLHSARRSTADNGFRSRKRRQDF